MKYTLEELKKEVFKNVYNVYEIFQDFFGEEFVDLQFENNNGLTFDAKYLIPSNIDEESFADTDLTEAELNEAKAFGNNWKACIYVWWPNVTITNENNQSIQIKDLYAKIRVSNNGYIPFEYEGFELLRSTFSYIQFNEGYVHSHMPRLYFGVHRAENVAKVKRWDFPCLGRGPIKKTILDLHTSNEEALWLLFCQELSMYVTVESLTGGPYFRLESVGKGSILSQYENYSLELYTRYSENPENLKIISDFTKYYVDHGNLSFSFKEGSFIAGMSFYDFIIDISNSFIEWYNSLEEKPIEKETFLARFLTKAAVSGRKFYTTGRNFSTVDYSSLEGTELFTFKSNPIKLHIEAPINQNNEIHEVLLLDKGAAMQILNNILSLINYRYENKHTKEFRRTQKNSSSISTKVCYL